MRKSTVSLVCAVFAAFAAGFYISRATIVPEPLPSSRITWWRTTDRRKNEPPVEYVMALSRVPNRVNLSLLRFDANGATEMELLWSVDMEQPMASIRYEVGADGASFFVQTARQRKQIPIKERRLSFLADAGADLSFDNERVAMVFAEHPNPSKELAEKLHETMDITIFDSTPSLIKWAKKDGAVYYAFVVKRLADK